MFKISINLLFCLLVILIGNASGQGNIFDPVINYSAGAQPFDVCCGDFDGVNGDDFAIACDGADYVYVFLNDGDGTFTYSDRYYAYENPRSIVTADFDGVNGLDLAVVTYNNDRLIVFLNDGDGTFDDVSRNMSVGTNTSPQCIYSADFDGFNGPDIATTNASGSNVSVFFNIGDGSFSAPLNLATGPNPGHLIAADFGGSSHPDIVVSIAVHDTLEILVNNGDSTFQSPIKIPAVTSSLGLDYANFDGINGNDLVIGTAIAGGISLYLNDGAGSFAAPVTLIPTYAYPRTVSCTDIDQDSNTDIVVALFNYDSVTVLLGNGDGSFQAHDTYAVGDGPFGLEDGNFDGDAYPDIITANMNGNNASVLLNKGGSLDIGDNPYQLPGNFSLGQNYPNPFNPITRIEYSLTKKCHVAIEIINVLGQNVRTLVDHEKSSGEHFVNWDGRNERDIKVSSGIYYYRIITDNTMETRKMVLLK